MKLGTYVYALAVVATGIIDIVWRGFDPAEQPIGSFGDNIPGQQIFAYVVAAALVAGGVAVLRRQTTRFGAAVLAIAYAIFAIFWLPRFYTAPQVLGVHPSVFVGVLGGVCQQLIIVMAALLIGSAAAQNSSEPNDRMTSVARWIVGLCSIEFGLNHLMGIEATARLVPKWIPFGQDFWVAFTGAAFALAGVAILIRVLDVVAARLLALMLLVFSGLALAPLIFLYPHNQAAWGTNVYNLVAVASVWIFASSIAHPQRN